MDSVLDINNYSKDELIDFLNIERPVTKESFKDGLYETLQKYPTLKDSQYTSFLRNAYKRLVEEDEEEESSEDEEYEIREGKEFVEDCMDRILDTCTRIYQPSDMLRKRNGEGEEVKDTENLLLQQVTRMDPEDDPLRNIEYDNLEPTFANNVPLSGNIVNRLESNKVLETGSHNILIPNRIQVQERFNVPILRGQFNPNVKNLFKRLINVDSIYRQILRLPPNNFTIDLAVEVEKVLSMRLVNFQIRKTWYAISAQTGTDFFLIRELEEDQVTPKNEFTQIKVEDGNYTEQELIDAVHEKVQEVFPDISVVYNKNSGKTSFQYHGDKIYEILFYSNREPGNSKVNNNLGWVMGFRNLGEGANVNVNSNDMRYLLGGTFTKVTSEGIVDTYGPKYILLGIDDFNKNHINHSIVNISEFDKKIKLPDYYSSNLDPDNPIFLIDTDASGNQIRSNLTEAQAFTIQQILLDDNVRRALDNRTRLISNSDIIAKIPVTKTTSKNDNERFPYILIDNSSLRNNIREYFGPVDISRIRVILYNDKGQILELNNEDFSFTLEIEQLYKY